MWRVAGVVVLAVAVAYSGQLTPWVAQFTGHGGDAHPVDVAKLSSDLGGAAGPEKQSAAIMSVMYLAAVPAVRPQLRRGGVTGQLVGLVAGAARSGEGDPQLQQLLPACLMAVARLASGDPGTQAQLLQESSGQHGAPLLQSLSALIKQGSAAARAASFALVHTLHQGSPGAVWEWADSQADDLLDAAVGLVEAGAVNNVTDVVAAGSMMLEVLAAHADGRALLAANNVPQLITQVVVTYAGTNSSSVISAASRLLLRLMDTEQPVLAASALREAGLLMGLMSEVRQGQAASLGPSLDLLAAALVQDAEVGQELVGAGLLSLCAQALAQKRQASSAEGSGGSPQAACWKVLRHMAGASGGQQPQAGRQADAGDGVEGPLDLTEAASSLLQTMRGAELPELHNAALDAVRDAAAQRGFAEAVVAAGGVQQLVHILQENATDDGSGARAWLVQGQRSSAMVLALLALQPHLRPHLVAAGAIRGLAAAMAMHARQEGLMQQVRITAAAALVPILGEDGRYNEAAVVSGVLEHLVVMYSSTSDPEHQVSARVLKLLSRDPVVKVMLEQVRIHV